MAFYEIIDEDAEQWLALPQPVLRIGREIYPANRYSPAYLTDLSPRQRTFEDLLRFLSGHLIDGRVPIYTRWNQGEFRLDLKCVRYALGRGIIASAINSIELGYVTHVILTGGENE